MNDMKKTIKSVLTLFLLFTTFALPCMGQLDARDLLDKTATQIRKSNGIEAYFVLTNYKQGFKQSSSKGMIRLKGEMFYLETQGILTWFDGKTQWTYLNENEEVNISNPTEEELQNINPLLLTSLYKKGYECSLGKRKEYEGKAIYEVILTDYNGDNLLANVTLYITQNDFIPVYIKVKEKGQSYNTIEIKDYDKEKKFEDKIFRFNTKQFPDAEIIDLR